MCRLFAQISPTPASALDFLVESKFSLLTQSNFKKSNLQKDGWGIAHFGNNGEPTVSKSPKPAYKEKEEFKTVAQGAISNVVIGHIRAASNPRNLPKARLLDIECAQPFSGEGWIFAHNGTLEIPLEVSEKLGPYRRRIKSLNDSEVYFWQFVKFHDRLHDVSKALLACVEENWSLWKDCRKRHPGKKAPYTGLNTLLSDGKSLHAFCHSATKGLASCGICNQRQPWATMSFTRRGGRVVVSSENMDLGPWTLFDSPELLSIVRGHGKAISIRRRRYKLGPQGLAALP